MECFWWAEDVPEFASAQMKAIIDMTVANLLQALRCQDLPENAFEETARKLKEIYDNREGILY